jgi:phosphoglycolate phosphatase
MVQTARDYRTIIWDWNGTLLDDTAVCIGCMNRMLADRNKPPINRETYREIFTFPVREYYVKAGFDFSDEPFEIPAHQFMDLYRRHVGEAPLQPGSLEVLSAFRQKGYRQVVLSAMEQELLIETLTDKKIAGFFDGIFGITNHLADGKNEIAGRLVRDLGGDRLQLCMVGDTIHDFEVSQETGIPCILVAHGHQSFRRLETLGCPVVWNLGDLPGIL